MQRVALLNWENLNQDYDLSKIFQSLALSWVWEWLQVINWKVTPGYAFINISRDQESFSVLFQNTSDVIIDTTWTKKVFIELDQSKIDDWSSNNSNGTWIWEIKIADNYPISNYVKLASITSWIITDEREKIIHKFENLSWEKVKLIAKSDWKIEIQKENWELWFIDLADLLLNWNWVWQAGWLVRTDSQNRIIWNWELLTWVRAKTEELLVRAVVPWETLVWLTDLTEYNEWNPTYTSEYQLKQWSIGQTFITPNRVNQIVHTLYLSFWSYYNAHVKWFRLFIYDSIAKSNTLWSTAEFNWNSINNGTKSWDITSANLKPNTQYYVELVVTNVYSTSYYARVRYQSWDSYSDWKMYIDWVESVWNDLYFSLWTSWQNETGWDTIVPFRQWYKELEDVTKVYRYEYWEQVDVLWFFKWVTDWYTDNKEIYGWQSLEVYWDNIFGWAFKHSQDSIRYLELDATYIWSWTANIKIYPLDNGWNLDIIWWSVANLDFDFSSISKIDLWQDIPITPNARYGFIISNSAWDIDNKIVLNWLEKAVYSETTQYSNTSQDDWNKYKDIPIAWYWVRDYSVSIWLWTNNASYIARAEIRQNWVTLWATSTYSTTEVTLSWTITWVDANNWVLELWTWWDYNVYAKNLNIEIANLEFDLFKSTTWLNWVSKTEWGVYSLAVSTNPITAIDIVNVWIIDVWQDIQSWVVYYLTQGGNLSTSETWNIHFWVRAVWQKILVTQKEKIADSINFSRWWTSASWTVKYNHNLWRKPKFITFHWVCSRDSYYFSSSSWSWSESWINKAIFKQYDNPGSYTTWYCILNKFYTWWNDYQYWKVIEVTDKDITIEWVYWGWTTSPTSFYITALLY